MSKQTARSNKVRGNIRKVAEKVSKWPEWKRGGSAATAKPTQQARASGAGKKQPG